MNKLTKKIVEQAASDFPELAKENDFRFADKVYQLWDGEGDLQHEAWQGVILDVLKPPQMSFDW